MTTCIEILENFVSVFKSCKDKVCIGPLVSAVRLNKEPELLRLKATNFLKKKLSIYTLKVVAISKLAHNYISATVIIILSKQKHHDNK